MSAPPYQLRLTRENNGKRVFIAEFESKEERDKYKAILVERELDVNFRNVSDAAFKEKALEYITEGGYTPKYKKRRLTAVKCLQASQWSKHEYCSQLGCMKSPCGMDLSKYQPQNAVSSKLVKDTVEELHATLTSDETLFDFELGLQNELLSAICKMTGLSSRPTSTILHVEGSKTNVGQDAVLLNGKVVIATIQSKRDNSAGDRECAFEQSCADAIAFCQHRIGKHVNLGKSAVIQAVQLDEFYDTPIILNFLSTYVKMYHIPGGIPGELIRGISKGSVQSQEIPVHEIVDGNQKLFSVHDVRDMEKIVQVLQWAKENPVKPITSPRLALPVATQNDLDSNSNTKMVLEWLRKNELASMVKFIKKHKIRGDALINDLHKEQLIEWRLPPFIISRFLRLQGALRDSES